MGTLDRIIEMQNQGMSETQISRQLQQEGVNPTEISNAFNQAQVKNAVSENHSNDSRIAGMQPSMMGDTQSPSAMGTPDAMAKQGGSTPAAEVPQPPAPAPKMSQEIGGNPQTPPMQAPQPPAPAPAQQNQQSPEIYPPQQQEDPYGQEQYGEQYAGDDYYYQQTPQSYQGDYYMPQGGTDTDTISEIAEQVVSEKFNEFHKKTGDLVTFKNSTQDKVADLNSRLKRIEETIDKLQQAIIGKIGEFGENSALIHKDLDNLHGTMSKMMNPLMDNYNELRKIARD